MGVSWELGVDRWARFDWGLTDAESEEEKQRYGVRAQAPVQVALLWLLSLVVHWGEEWVKE